MKRWIGLFALALALMALGATLKWWAPLLQIVEVKTELLQGLEAAVQLILIVGGGIFAFRTWFRRPQKSPETPAKSEASVEKKVEEPSVLVERGMQDSVVVTGDPAALRHAYLNRMFETSRYLSLAGVDPKVASEAEARLQLEAVYTALLTLTPEMHDDMLRGKAPDKEARRRSALEQLNQHTRLVLLGDPGSGKSTFVNFVTLCLTGEALRRSEANLALLTAPLPAEDEKKLKEKASDEPQPWEHGPLLPVRLILRDFAARGLPEVGKKASAEHLWRFIANELKAAALADYAPHLRDELLKKGGLLLLDGLDEVPEADQRRTQIKQAVEDFIASFPRCRVLVTSRTYAYQKQDWRLPQFSEAVLAPFTKGQIRRFVEHWYMHIGALRGWHSENAQGHAELLKRAIFSSDRLQALAERPLLLTLMASLHAWRGGSLPEKREELYADTVDLLLDWWERPKTVRDASGQVRIEQPSLAEWLKVDRQKVRDLLNTLAYQAHAAQPREARGTADLPEGELVSGLMHLSQNPEVNPTRLVEYLSQRAGLLLPRGVQVYTFPHRTFQEYLAACYLTDHDYPDKLAELVQKDFNRWREVALLAGAKAARGAASTVWSLVEALCYRELSPASTTKEYWAGHLAGQALVEIADLTRVSERNRSKVTRVQQWLVHILQRHDFPAVERALAGNNLARLGDRRDEVMTLDKMEFCLVPAGPFWMGEGEELHRNEHLHYDFWMARFPVTNAQFMEFVKAGGYQEARYWPEAKVAKVWNNGEVNAWNDDKPRSRPYDFGAPFNLPNHPVVGITWYEMLAFTRWLTETGHEKKWFDQNMKIVLPSEAEWEKAARGGEEILQPPIIIPLGKIQAKRYIAKPGQRNEKPQRRFPWGDDPDANCANYSDTGIGTTSAVGCFPNGKSPYGVQELSGNVWEWTRSLWGKDVMKPDFKYPYDPTDGRENLNAPDEVLRVLRGGAFDFNGWRVRCAVRLRHNPNDRDRNNGFRLAAAPVGCSH